MAKTRVVISAKAGAALWFLLILFVVIIYAGSSSAVVRQLGSSLQSLTRWPSAGNMSQQEADSARVNVLESQISQLSGQSGITKDWQQARVVSRVINSRQWLLVNKGRDDGVTTGMTAVGNGFFVGKVWHVEAHQATIMLIGDPDLSVAAIVTDTKADGLVSSLNGGVVFSHVVDPSDIRGKSLETSGVGGLSPAGLPIGKVTAKISTTSLGEITWGVDYPDATDLNWVRLGDQ